MSEEIKLPEIKELTAKEIEDNSVASLRSIPGRSSAFGAPQKTAKEVQEAFDALPKLVAGKVNDIVNAYNDLVAAAKAIDDKADDIAIELDAEATAREKAIADEAQAREKAVSEEAQARDSAVKAESVARAAAITALKDEILGGASDAYNTLKELEDALKDNDSDVVAILAAIAAVEASLAGKVDAKDVSTSATHNTIAKRISGGRLAVGRAAADGDAVPLEQVREEIARYIVDNGGNLPPDLLDGITNAIKMIDTLEAKVANLEAGLAPDMFVVDDTTAYMKTIPTDAKPYAQILAVGGMTHKIAKYGENLLNTDFANNSDPEVSAEGDTIYLNYTSYGWNAWFSDLFRGLVIGKQYILTASATGGDLAPASIDTGDVPLDTPFTLTEEHLYASFSFQPGYADDGAAGQPCGGEFTVILREVTEELLDTPVTALDIVGKNLFDEKAITEFVRGGGNVVNSDAEITSEYIRVKHGFYSHSVIFSPFSIFLRSGQPVLLSADAYIPNGGAPSLLISGGLSYHNGKGYTTGRNNATLSSYDKWERVSFLITAEKDAFYLVGLQGKGEASQYSNLDVRFKNIKVTTDTTDTTYSPYRKTTFAIPTEVQALDGYGKTGYGIEWDDDGKPWWVTPDAHTDISQYFTEDNFIAVEGGGTITAVNAEGLAAPTTIIYQKRGT